MDWYYADGDQRVGPVTEEKLRTLLGSVAIDDSTLVWNKGMSDWATLGSTGFSMGATPASIPGSDSVQCVECGRTFPRSDVLSFRGSYVCGGCKNIFFQRVKEGGAAPGEFQYAGFWIRFVAKFFDNILMSVVVFFITMMLGAVAGGAGESGATLVAVFYFLASYGLPIAYNTFFVGKYGATPGKMAFGIKIVRPDGDDVTYLRAFGRYFAEILSALIFLIGYIMAAFDDEKRSLHDRICDTRVIRTR